jgi:uncharacterized protein DUF4054
VGIVVQWTYDGWIAQYPELTYVSDKAAAAYLTIATTLHRNDGGGPVEDAATQLNLLNMVVAHLAQLYAPNADGTPNASLVGRITDATQGSVSVSTDYGTITPSMAFWLQTKYGALYWAATAPYRTARYLPHRRFFDRLGRAW